MKDKLFNYDFNHNVDVCQFNKALEGMDKTEILENSKLDEISKLNIFHNLRKMGTHNYEKDPGDNILKNNRISKELSDKNTAVHSKMHGKDNSDRDSKDLRKIEFSGIQDNTLLG